MKFQFIIFIFLIILVSGCINQFSSASGKGVEIESFEFTPDKISTGQKTLLSVNIVNEGDVDILKDDDPEKNRKAYIYLYGLPEGDWDIPKDEDKIPSGVTFKETSQDNRIIGPLDLYAANPQYRIPAGERGVIWIPQFIGSLPKGQTFNYDFQARICYDYYTEAVGKVELISEEEWLSKFGEIKQHQIELDHTAGPLRVKIDSQQPIIVSSDDSSEISLEMEIENVGGGTVVKPIDYQSSPDSNCITQTENIKNLNYVKISSISIGPKEQSICKIEKCIPSEEGTDIFFTKGKTGKFVCTGICTGKIPQQKLDLIMRLDYVYYKDAEASIEVKGI